MHPRRIEIEIEMEIDIEIVALGELEDARDLAIRIAVDIGSAADRAGAVLAGLNQQLVATGIADQPLLRKHAKFEIDRPGEIAFQFCDRIEALEADARIDLDMGPHPRGALHDRLLQGAAAAFVNVVFSEILLRGGHRSDHFRHRIGAAGAAFRNAGLVEMDMRLDEARHHQPAIQRDVARSVARRHRRGRFYRGNAAVRNRDIDRIGASTGDAPVAQHVVEQHEKPICR